MTRSKFKTHFRNIILFFGGFGSLTTNMLSASEKTTGIVQKFASLVDSSTKTSTNINVFDNSSKDIYSMTRDQLQQVPSAVLQKEIDTLTARDQSDTKDLANIMAFNLAMCNKLKQLQSECVTYSYFTQGPTTDVNCTDASTPAAPADTDSTDSTKGVWVRVQNAESKSFRILANNMYVSNEFNIQTNAPLTFTRLDNQDMVPPRIREVTSFTIVTVTSGSTIVNQTITNRTQRPAKLGITITVNGLPLLDNFALQLPSDPMDISDYQLNPSSILQMGRKPNCVVTLDDLNSMEEASKVYR